MMRYQHYGYYGEYGHGGEVIPVILIVLFIILIVMLIRRRGMYRHMGMFGGMKHRDGLPSALDIVKERYAKGEINKEEFEQKKKDLLS